MKLKVNKPIDIEITHRNLEYKKGEVLGSCGNLCKKKNLSFNYLSTPYCKVFEQGIYVAFVEGQNASFNYRCNACFEYTKGNDIAEETVIDEQLFTFFLCKKLGKRYNSKEMKKLASKMIEGDGKVHGKTHKSYLNKYNINLEELWDEYFDTRKPYF